MQLIGLALFALVVWFGFADRSSTEITFFDPNALFIALGGSAAAILLSSNRQTVVRSALCVRELIPGLSKFKPENEAVEGERTQLVQLWKEGQRGQAVTLAEQSRFPAIQAMLTLTLARATPEDIAARFTEIRHGELQNGSQQSPTGNCWQNWRRRSG